MKRSEFNQATENGKMPVFRTNDGYKCISITPNDESVNGYVRGQQQRSANAVILRAVKFTTDEQGNNTVEMVGRAFVKQINQVNLFAADYTTAYEQIAAMAIRSSNARRARMEAEAKENTAREHDLAICLELLPAIKDTLLRFVNCRIDKDFFTGNITINIPASQLENMVALLSHAEPQA